MTNSDPTINLKTARCSATAELLDKDLINNHLETLHHSWQLSIDEKKRPTLQRRFSSTNFKSCWQLSNHISELAEQQDHHPDLQFGWGYCIVTYTTHSANGLTLNDFICANKVDDLAMAIDTAQ